MPKTPNTYDLMLCGGGVIGLSIAYQCARHGWKVLVVDSSAMGQGSSWAGAGILPAGATVLALDPIEQLRALSHNLHRQWSEELLQITAIDNEYRRCGGLYLARTLAERATLAANCMWWNDHGIEYETWSNECLSKKVPALQSLLSRETDLRSWYVPDDCRVRNPRHIQALLVACRSLGVTLVEHQAVDRFEAVEGRIQYAVCGTEVVHAERYCITSGAWASQLLGGLGLETGILPVRGQMILYKLNSPEFSTVVNDGHRYLVPRDDGHVLAGSCEEEVGFDCNTTEEMVEQLQLWAEELCPLLSRDKVKQTWAGLRPGSFDTYPYLGTLLPWENGFIAAGHFRHGLHWSTGTALLMYQWMSGSETAIDMRPFRLGRGQTSGNQLERHA